ncbi:Hypothetical protein SRAE_2000178400 [Strongyloides ratti]|uniref:DUF8031 domain-containing protein n=1 Tax=Strongyloides ratti TaxID=34506 RepID=A0A090MYG0_STRRB|nr:Hypothetical protein SRAE_2000178400 [Strongyloides ratti]CEF67119.1 Hypothetical protein SRAE_2000178400 [Strongyloides ratti]
MDECEGHRSKKVNFIMSISKLQEEFVELQKEISAFQGLLNSAIDESEFSLEVVQHSTNSNVWDLKVRLDDIALLIAQEKKNAKRKCEIRQIADNVHKMLKKIEVEIKKAEIIESNEDSTLKELGEAYESLKEIEEEDLPKLQAEYSKLPITESEDDVRNEAFEEQVEMVRNLKNIQSSIINKIETTNMLDNLISSFNKKFHTTSEGLKNAQFDVIKITDIKNNDLLIMSRIVFEMKELIKETGIRTLDFIQKYEKKLDDITKSVDLKLAEVEKKIVNTVTKKLESPLKDINFENIEKDISLLPLQSSAYTDLIEKVKKAKAKLDLQRKTKEDLEIIVKTLKEINAFPKNPLPVNEHILTFKKKLNDLVEYLKPKTDAFVPTGDVKIDKDIEKQKQKVEETIVMIKKELEAKELEKANNDLVLKVVSDVVELLSESEKQPDNSNLLSSKEVFSKLKARIINKSNELNALKKKSFGDNLEKVINNNIKIIDEAMRNTDVILFNIEKCEKETIELQGEWNRTEEFADRAIEMANELIERYTNSPQLFEDASKDIETISFLIEEINGYVKVISQISDNFKNYNLDNSLFVEKLDNYKGVVIKLEELKIKVEKDVSRELNLIKMKKRLQDTLNQIVEKANILINKVKVDTC